jgi:hypothetical protein
VFFSESLSIFLLSRVPRKDFFLCIYIALLKELSGDTKKTQTNTATALKFAGRKRSRVANPRVAICFMRLFFFGISTRSTKQTPICRGDVFFVGAAYLPSAKSHFSWFFGRACELRVSRILQFFFVRSGNLSCCIRRPDELDETCNSAKYIEKRAVSTRSCDPSCCCWCRERLSCRCVY